MLYHQSRTRYPGTPEGPPGTRGKQVPGRRIEGGGSDPFGQASERWGWVRGTRASPNDVSSQARHYPPISDARKNFRYTKHTQAPSYRPNITPLTPVSDLWGSRFWTFLASTKGDCASCRIWCMLDHQTYWSQLTPPCCRLLINKGGLVAKSLRISQIC